MNRVATSLGGRTLGSIVLHGIESDIMHWSRDDAAELGTVVETLWQRRLGE
jgi:hypothetical protein